ncbi:MAG: bifunctional 2-polyprenyl-6-hydroxyphenol methylase/3-demethylubiquinol 3-O-methyltransferase UbiG [Acetobacter sp.]|jgi:2-polyprenyl-6-hydroxyphenyl methylase/3-demethylubiquinone-9 3-methyltransferase|nr:bifunctional 2-polyprenyl-6-hydroxyphenol methylase/3-demethylubiquinol 3-O-methyltransferase UbiG [Acetobacter sp.]
MFPEQTASDSGIYAGEFEEENGVTTPSSVEESEIAHFSALAADWWNPRGPMRPLHAMNPLRIRWIDRFLPLGRRGSAGLKLLDIGCGAGLASEALAKTGRNVLGLDASDAGISAAKQHLADNPLPPGSGALDYRCGSAEDLVAEGRTFDAVIALEVIEHVADPVAFMALLSKLTQPGGRVFVSTMNRTPAAWALAKLGAEYIARLLPVGTHDWKKFITPAELASAGRKSGLRLCATAGMKPSFSGWKESRDMSVNYIAYFERD